MDTTKVVNKQFTKQYDMDITRKNKIFGNPFIVGVHGTHEEVIELYRQYAKHNPVILEHLEELRGKTLGCVCKPNTCHGDVLIEMLQERSIMYKKLVIGIDESYSNCGISIAADGKLLKVSSTNYYKKLGAKASKTEKRKYVYKMVQSILRLNVDKAKEVQIIVERMRSNSSNNSHGGSIKYIKATAALIATIVDAAYEFDVKVYSVDTRSWKGQIVGTSKAKGNKYKVDAKKWPTIVFVKKLGFDVGFKSARGIQKFDDDASDSACIALYGFLPGKLRKLKLEE